MNSSTTDHSGAATVNLIERIGAVLDARGIRKSQHYKDIKAGLYTPPVKIGPRASG